MSVPFLGSVPIDPDIVTSGDAGIPFIDDRTNSLGAQAFADVVRLLLGQQTLTHASVTASNDSEEDHCMKIAIPVQAGRVSMHFGHCEEFALYEVNEDDKAILGKTAHKPPAHEPGALPRWLHELGADVIITGGMGQRAQQLFAQSGISVVLGAPAESPEQIAAAYLNGTLQPGENVCDH
jgi:ATP-binding protein involved in chromosome partitioning